MYRLQSDIFSLPYYSKLLYQLSRVTLVCFIGRSCVSIADGDLLL